MNSPLQLHRRQVLRSLAAGSVALPFLISEGAADETPSHPLAVKQPHFTAKAKRVIFLFMTGGVSHIDTFDHKPFLTKRHDQEHRNRQFYKGSDWKFRPYGQSGMMISDLFPHVGSVADDICMINSMQNINGDHFGATIGIHTGSATFNRPSIGSWVSYGLGTENRNLPAFVAIAPGLPYGGGQSWGSDFLPVHHQGTRIIPGDEPIANMHRAAGPIERQLGELELLRFLNQRHFEDRKDDSKLEARMDSFETAFGMQMEAPDVFDLSRESQRTLNEYGLEQGSTDGFGWQCLVARRLAEKGVRFIELIDGDTRLDSNWDSHARMANYNKLAKNVDQPIAALINDLKVRGMFDDTLVVWTTEFGRPAFVPSPGTAGRGHHARVYTSWLAGAGIKGGMVYGQSDELGMDVAENVVSVHDFQATILHQLGLDHERLTYRHAGRDYRLTDVHGEVVTDVLTG